MDLLERMQDFIAEKVFGEPPVLRVYGNCESCLASFGNEIKHYVNLKDASAAGRIVSDFELAGKKIRVEGGKRIEHDGHVYHGMRHISVSELRGWLRNQKVDVK